MRYLGRDSWWTTTRSTPPSVVATTPEDGPDPHDGHPHPAERAPRTDAPDERRAWPKRPRPKGRERDIRDDDAPLRVVPAPDPAREQRARARAGRPRGRLPLLPARGAPRRCRRDRHRGRGVPVAMDDVPRRR